MSMFISKYVVCPFYRKHNDNKICCEGVSKSNTINLVFEDCRKQKAYSERYCNNIENYQNCMICRMLNRKYQQP